MRFAVVGGGITGLAAAFELSSSQPVEDAVVLEASERLGGKILTTPFAGRPVDAGADAFLARHPAGIRLAAELGLTDRLVSPAERSALVAVERELRPLPTATLLGVPTDLDEVGRTGVLTAAGLARAGRDPGPTLPDGEDVSIGAIVRSRLGDEVLDRLVGPLVGGINAGNPDALSVRATTPQLAAAAAAPDMVLGARAVRASASSDPEAPVFLAPRDGMGDLVDALAARLPAVRTGAAVDALEPAGAGWRLVTGDEELDVDAVVLAVPSQVAGVLVHPVDRVAAGLLGGIEHASVVLVTVALPAGGVTRRLDASGFLVARPEQGLLTACSFASSKWPHLRNTPDDPVILRLSAGRDGDERALELDDETLVDRLMDELDRFVGVTSPPLEVRVTRWPRSFPQYRVGHLDRVDAIEKALAASAPGLAVAGAGYRGLGVPACIEQGRRAARATLDSVAAARS